MTTSGPPKPGPGQESVWDYPVETRIEPSSKHVQIVFDGVTVADTRNAKRLLERGRPPVFYIPREDVRMDMLETTERTST
jgi:uncharacterized protein (DUF427 family)